MFGRKDSSAETPTITEADTAKSDGKGRPTPTRKEAEAARKASLKVPSDPKEAKKAMRERERAQRTASRAALMAGDERAMPTRDAGPVRSYVRDTVDSRFSVGEIFIPVAIIVLLSGFLRNQVLISVTYYVWLIMLAATLLDIGWLIFKLRRNAAESIPGQQLKAGDYFYGAMRSLTLRRLRLPPPKFRAGGKPAKPRKSRS